MNAKIVHEPRFESGRLPARSLLAAIALVIVCAVIFAFCDMAQAQEVKRIRIAYISQVVERPPRLSNLDLPPEDEGIAGGRVAVEDNNTTGRFLKQEFSLKAAAVAPFGDAMAALEALLKEGFAFVILNVPAETLLAMAEAVRGANVLLFNAGAPDDRLRDEDCRGNVLHIAPSRAMLTDALAQYLVWKRWRDWFLVVGGREGDRLFAAAVRQSAEEIRRQDRRRANLGFRPGCPTNRAVGGPGVHARGRPRYPGGRRRVRRIRPVSGLPADGRRVRSPVRRD